MGRTSARVIPGREKKALLVSRSTEDGWVLRDVVWLVSVSVGPTFIR